MAWLGTNLEKPSDEMRRVLMGKLHYDDASPAVQSMCSKEFFDAAVVIVKMESKESRKKALQKIPETCRVQVEEYVRKVWPIRNKLSQSRSNTR